MKKQITILFFILLSVCLIPYAAAQYEMTGASFIQDSVSFVSQPSGFKMAGTLSYPSGNSRHPAVILIWGTGPHTRDQVISNFPMFKIIAEHLNQNGYAVLRIDKRSFGLSEGPDKNSEQQTTTAELADDIYSALQFLKTQPRIDPDNIGLIGHSEGAWIAEMVAMRDPDVKRMILLGAPILNGGEIQKNQMSDNLLKLGADSAVVTKVRPQIDRYFDFIRNGYADDSLYYSIGRDFLLAHGMEEKDINDTLIDQLLDGFKTPWYQYFFSATPGDLISELKVPVLFMYGEEDMNVNLKTNLPPLLNAIKKNGNKNMTLIVLPGLDHFFEEEKDEVWNLSENFLKSLSFWLNDLNGK